MSARARLTCVSLLLGACACACLAAPRPASAADPRLARRLDAATAAAVESLMARAEGEGLPTEPLVTTALEGASQHAGGRRIVAAVARERADLMRARAALGATANGAEWVAAAAALRAGVPADTLAGLRAAAGHRSLVVPLVVLADLVTRGVPSERASAGLMAALREGADDGGLLALRLQTASAIQGGVPPSRAIERWWRAGGGSAFAPGPPAAAPPPGSHIP